MVRGADVVVDLMPSLPRTIKLLNCLRCGDVVRLYRHTRYCKCKASEGKYVGQYSVEFSGPARILGIEALGYQDAPVSNEVNLSKLKARKWYVVPIESGEVYPDVPGDFGEE